MFTRIAIALAVLSLSIGQAEAGEKSKKGGKKKQTETVTVQDVSPLNPVYVSGGESTNNGFNVVGKPQVTIGPDGKALITQGRISQQYLGAVTENHVAVTQANSCADARSALAYAASLAIAGQMEVTLSDGTKTMIRESSGAEGVPTVRLRVNADCSIEFDTNRAAEEANRSWQLTNATWDPYSGFPPGLGGNAGEALFRLGQIDSAYGSQGTPTGSGTTTAPPKRSAGDAALLEELDK